MTSTPFDHSRTDIGLDPVVRSSTGSPRPALRVPLQVMTVHYAGAGRSWLDSGDTAEEILSIERYAQATGKPNEYNSVSDIDSETWEYAGPFLAAHNGKGNPIEWGHIALYGLEEIGDREADRLIAGIRRARAQCVAGGYLTPDHLVEPHAIRRPLMNPGMGGTLCPGPLWATDRYWAAIAAPLEPLKEGSDMYLLQPPAERAGSPWFAIEGGSARVATGHDVTTNVERYRDDGDDGVERYDLMHEAVLGRPPERSTS